MPSVLANGTWHPRESPSLFYHVVVPVPFLLEWFGLGFYYWVSYGMSETYIFEQYWLSLIQKHFRPGMLNLRLQLPERTTDYPGAWPTCLSRGLVLTWTLVCSRKRDLGSLRCSATLYDLSKKQIQKASGVGEERAGLQHWGAHLVSCVRLPNFDALVFLPARGCDQNPAESPHANASTVPGTLLFHRTGFRISSICRSWTW